MAEIPPPPVPPRLMGPLKRLLPEAVYYRYVGRHEKGSMAAWNQLVIGLPEGAAVLDVGAYHGIYAVATSSLRPDLQVWAFEPNDGELEQLREACKPLGIVVEAVAVAEKSGKVAFSVNGEASRIIADADSGVDYVPAVSLDEWLPEPDLEISLMKVDVEGAEDGVFKGGRELLERCRPIILCEVLTDSAGTRRMAELPPDYRFFKIDEDHGPRPIDRPTRWAWRHKNCLLVPAERLDEVPV